MTETSRPPVASTVAEATLALAGRGRDRALLLYPGVFLVALAVGLVFARERPDTYDTDVMLQVARSLLDDGSFHVARDVHGFNTPVPIYGIGMSLLMATAMAGAEALGVDPLSAAMDVNAWLFAATVAGAVWFARLCGLSGPQSLAVAGLLGMGTSLLPYTATGFAEPAIALAVMLGLVAMQAAGGEPTRRWAPLLAGAATGLALLCRTDSLVLVAPFLLGGTWWMAGRTRRAALLEVLALAPFALAWAWYNHVRFGAPWRLGYGDLPFDHPILDGVLGLLVSPGRGLVWYVPIAVLALGLLVAAWRRSPVLAVTAAALLVVRIVFYARWWAWNGGWNFGPRFLVPAMPVLAVGFVELVRRFPRWPAATRAGVLAVLALSAVVQVAGAAVRYESSALVQEGLVHAAWGGPHAASKENQRIIDDAMFDWGLFDAADAVARMRRGEDLTGKVLLAPTSRRALGVVVLGALGIALVVAGGADGGLRSHPRGQSRRHHPGPNAAASRSVGGQPRARGR